MNDPKFLLNVGGRIRQIRVEKNMSQYDLALRCDFEKASMSRIESGKTNPTLLTLRKISKALNVEMAEFFRS